MPGVRFVTPESVICHLPARPAGSDNGSPLTNRNPAMALDILRGTPVWVWIALAILLQRGLAMTRPQELTPGRAAVLPGVFVLLSLLGVISTFGAHAAALACWLAGLCIAASAFQSMPASAGAYYDAKTRRFHLPGSYEPLILMLLIFAVKYSVGVSLAMHPELHGSGDFLLLVSGAYGALSGSLLGRALRLRTLHRRSVQAAVVVA